MATELVIPSPGESITEVVLGRWHKHSGEWVEKDDPVVEIESDKVTFDLSAPESGVLEVAAEEGAYLPVGAVIGRVDPAGKPTRKPDAAKAGLKAEMAAGPPQSKESAGDPGTQETPAEREAPLPAAAAAGDGIQRATSMARKLAAERGVDLASLQGTGASGRITKSDVLTAVGANSPPPAPAPPTDAPPDEGPAPQRRGVRRERMSMLRQRIAERLVEAQHTAAMLTTFNEADMSAVMRLRAEHKEAFAERHGVGLGIVSFFVTACVSALQTFPRVNAFIVGDEIEYHDYVDMSIAVGTERGLVVPVIRNTETLSFAEIERAIHDVATRAREGKLNLDEMTGGTFTISNGGVYGSLLSTPILNPPQSAIIGLHKISKRPVEDPDNSGQIVLRPMMNLALSYDHRVIDGEQAVKFLLHVRHQIEQPQRMLLGI